MPGFVHKTNRLSWQVKCESSRYKRLPMAPRIAKNIFLKLWLAVVGKKKSPAHFFLHSACDLSHNFLHKYRRFCKSLHNSWDQMD